MFCVLNSVVFRVMVCVSLMYVLHFFRRTRYTAGYSLDTAVTDLYCIIISFYVFVLLNMYYLCNKCIMCVGGHTYWLQYTMLCCV